jgi:signal transduction histidine kinase
MSVEENELSSSIRAYLAHTLHGGVVQRLSSVVGALGAHGPLAPGDRRRCVAELEAALADLRALIVEGFVDPLRDVPSTLETAVREACAGHPDLPIQIHCDGDAAVPAEVARFVRDFVSESARNAAKHAHPDAVIVTVEASPRTARVQVRNDGVESPAGCSGTGLGLRLLAADAARLGARVDARPAGPESWGTELTLPLAARQRRFDRTRRLSHGEP